MNIAKEFKCPHCYHRNSAVFTNKKLKTTCIGCGEEFSASLDIHDRIKTAAGAKKQKPEIV